jgi:hypothetical protein
MSNNWHRIMWQLSEPDSEQDPDHFFLDNFFHETNSNRFWLEPEVHTGPAVTIGEEGAEAEFPANSLCFRIRFAEGEMRAPWKNCVVFPTGSQVPAFDDKGKPIVELDTEQLLGKTKVNGEDTIVTICMDARNDPTVLHIFASMHDEGNHLGAGIAHQ